MPMILLFLHGWGFDARFWIPLLSLLPDCRTACDDRGYSGTPHDPRIDEDCVVVAHSFGTMRALAAPPPRCRGLVAINGFDRFTPGVPRRVLDRMIARFDENPAAVLTDFRRRCGEEAPFGDPFRAPLRDDLVTLRDGDCSPCSAAWPAPILSLQSTDDPLLPAPMRDTVFAAAPHLERRLHPTGGHLLPAADAPYCARAIGDFVERLA